MKKFLFIFALVVSLVLSGAGTVAYAMTYPEDFPELPLDSNSNILIINIEGRYRLYFVELEENISLDNAWFGLKYFTDTTDYVTVESNAQSKLHYYLLEDDVWEFKSTRELESGQSNITSIDDGQFEYIWTNSKVIDNSSNEVVFPLPPGPLGMPEGTLTQILTQENPLKEILKLLPMAILCLVGFVALRKALRTLETILKTA